MRMLATLRQVIEEVKCGYTARRWIDEWLFPNPKNEHTIIPHDAEMPIIMGHALLFELPYQSITRVVEAVTKEEVAPFVCVRDAKPTQILIVDMKSKKIVSCFEHEPGKFRFKNATELEGWMKEQAMAISKAMGKEDLWKPAAQ